MFSSILKQFEPLFYPKSLAIIGASNDPAKFGNIILSALLEIGFAGKIYPVNPEGQEINGLKVFPSIKDIPHEVDFVIITIPAPLVLNSLKDCLQKGVKGVEILTSGFKETGTPEGKRMEEEIARLARSGLRIIGPNCFGIYCPESGLTILPGQNFLREAGPVGFLSQSGGLCADFGQIAKGLGIRFSKMVSYGNGCDVAACDLLEYFFADPETKIIAGYIEGVEDGSRFLRLLRENRGKKPVIIWKAGLTASGSQAVMSHTGALSGSRKVWSAALKQGGVIQVESAEELIDTIYAFLYLPSTTGPRIAVMGGGGAISVAASDIMERLGLAVPPFSPEIFQKLKASFPPVGNSLRNPVDLGNPMIPPPMLKIVMEAAGQDERIDTLIVIQILFYILFQMRHRLKMDDQPLRQFSYQPELLKAAQEIRTKYGKAIILVLPDITTESGMIDLEIEWRRERDFYQAAGFPVFKTLQRAARALRNFIAFQRMKAHQDIG
ncbi:MAG: acetate--CoA ligase family protein [Thermodesulfobacteriota bacterium]